MAMSREDFLKIAKGIRAVYGVPKDQTAFDVWYELLKDMDYPIAAAGAELYMQTEHYPPTPADIRKAAATLQEIPTEISEGEAWVRVRKAISNGTYGYEDEYARLPESIQRALGNAKQLHYWAIDENFNEGVAQSQFLRSYRIIEQRKKTLSMLSESTRKALTGCRQELIGVEETN